MTLVDIPIKKGSATEAVSKHIRGSNDIISKILSLIITDAKIIKKTKDKR